MKKRKPKRKKALKRVKLKHKKTNEKINQYNQILRYSVVLLLFAILFVAFYLPNIPTGYTALFTAASQGEGEEGAGSPSQGEIYSIFIEPEETSVLEGVTINLGVRNTGDEVNEYVLDIFISKEGKVKDENSFTFSLQPDKGITFSPTFTPSNIGQHEIVGKLYDKYKTVLYDTEISDIEVISDIGPFDLSLDVISRTVGPNDEVPLIVSMKNTGIKGTDVKIAVSMDCLEQEDIYKDFFIFVKGSGDVKKSLTITACNEEGLRHITAKLILFDHTFAESLNQVVINSTHYRFDIEFPEQIKIKQGESKVFDVYIKNTAEINVNNLRVIVENIPLEWTTIIPSIVIRVEPNETAMFIVNMSIPKDATVIEYPIKIAIGSDEMLVQEESSLEVITGEFVTQEEAGVAPIIPERFQYQLIIVFIVGIIAVVAVIMILRRSGSKKYRGKKRALRSVKDITK